MSNPGSRGGWSTQVLTKNLMCAPKQEYTLRANLLGGIALAQTNKMDALGEEYRNFRRSHRIESCRGVVKDK